LFLIREMEREGQCFPREKHLEEFGTMKSVKKNMAWSVVTLSDMKRKTTQTEKWYSATT
jgi:hypothetical protein